MRRQDSLARLSGFRKRERRAQFLHGHHPLWARLPTSRRPLFITMTRDPIERFLSNYYFIRAKAERSGKIALKRRVLTEDPDLFATRVMESPAAKRLNGMCLYLARSGRFEDARNALETRLFAATQLDNLGPFSCRIADALGRPAPDFQHVNIGKNRPNSSPLSPKVEARLKAALDPDRRLHDHIGELGHRSDNLALQT